MDSNIPHVKEINFLDSECCHSEDALLHHSQLSSQAYCKHNSLSGYPNLKSRLTKTNPRNPATLMTIQSLNERRLN